MPVAMAMAMASTPVALNAWRQCTDRLLKWLCFSSCLDGPFRPIGLQRVHWVLHRSATLVSPRQKCCYRHLNSKALMWTFLGRRHIWAETMHASLSKKHVYCFRQSVELLSKEGERWQEGFALPSSQYYFIVTVQQIAMCWCSVCFRYYHTSSSNVLSSKDREQLWYIYYPRKSKKLCGLFIRYY